MVEAEFRFARLVVRSMAAEAVVGKDRTNDTVESFFGVGSG